MSTKLLLALLLLSPFYGRADYKWMPYSKPVIPDSVKNEDAIYLENVTTIDFLQHSETSIVQFKRIYINTKKGAEAFAQREIYQFSGGVISMKKTRIIKANGDILELGDDNIIETYLEEKLQYETKNHRRIQFIFPNLEQGDVIDVVYQIDFSFAIYSKTLYMEDDLYSLSTRITLRNAGTLEVSLYPSDNMKNYTATYGYVPTFSWTKTGVSKEIDGYYNAPRPGSSKIVYVLWRPHEVLTYSDIYASDLQNYTPSAGINSLTKQIVADGVLTGLESPMEKIVLFLRHLSEADFEWIAESDISPAVKTVDYYDRGVINNTLFFRYVQALCQQQNLPYETGYTCSLLNGRFEHGYVALDQLDLRFIYIKDEFSNGHFLFGPQRRKAFYHLDEIPYYAEGNQSVLLAGDKINLSEASSMELPLSKAKDNKHTGSIVLKVNNPHTDSIAVKRTDLLSGHYSYLLRGRTQDWLEQFAIADTIITSTNAAAVYPFEQTYKQEKTVAETELITPVDDSLSWFMPSAFLPENIFFEGESVNELGDYIILPFLRYEKFSVYLESTDAITLLENVRSFNMGNGVANLQVDALQVNPKMIKITYELELKKRIIGNQAEREDLQQLLENWRTIQSKKWVVRMN